MLRQIVLVLDADSARIDQLEEAVVMFHQVINPVARNAGTVFDDRDSDSC